ncbi:unnamed protein product [Closterium sp. NIES-54]
MEGRLRLLTIAFVIFLLTSPDFASAEVKTAEDSKEKDQDEGSGDDGKAAAGKRSSEENSSSLEDRILDAELTQGDILKQGPCADEAGRFCADVEVGNRTMERCLTMQYTLLQLASTTDANLTDNFSDKCLDDIRNFKIQVYKNISIDKEWMEDCKEDVASFCDDKFLYPGVGSVLACLREAKASERLSDLCKNRVFEAQRDAAADMAFDPQLNQTCAADAQRLCKGVPAGEGRVQDCLRQQRTSLSWDCMSELFRQEVEGSGDIRLNVRLFKACLQDKRRFCPDVPPGDARVKDCLEEHRLEEDFSKGCKVEFDKMMERRASDFRLDFNLQKYCHKDIVETCYQDASDMTGAGGSSDAKVIQCLQDYRDELKDPRCRQQVHMLTKRAAEDIRFDRALGEACKDDVQAHCAAVPKGQGRVFMCLQDNRGKLKGPCKEALFREEVRFAEDIDFKFVIRKACSDELQRLCKDKEDAMACLQEHMGDADMSKGCSEEVKNDQQHAAEDYRLNFRLARECFADVQKLCMHACDESALLPTSSDPSSSSSSSPASLPVTCGGATLRCLTGAASNISSATCRDEVFHFQKQEVADVALDVPLQVACMEDVKERCGGERDHSKALACLRQNRDALSEGCKEEELRFSEMEASDIRLTPTLMNACGLELHQFCRKVPPAAGQAFRCLQLHVQEPGMSVACRSEVDLQTTRQSKYYKLDAAVKQQCGEDVERLCKVVDEGREGHALVLKCLVDYQSDLSASCHTEVGAIHTEVAYAVRMALWMYHRGSDLTKGCDALVDSRCANYTSSSGSSSNRRASVSGAVVGQYAQCLMDQPKVALGNECSPLVALVGKEGGHVGGEISSELLQETLNKIALLQLSQGGSSSSVASRSEGLVLTGWVAFTAVTALTALLLAVAYAVYRKLIAFALLAGLWSATVAATSSSSSSSQGSDSTSALTANKVGALFVFLGSSFLGVFVPYFIPVRQNILKFGVLFSTGLFIGMSLLYLTPETEELFADLTTNKYPLAYLVVVMGVFLTWLCDLIVKTVWRKRSVSDDPAKESDPTVAAVLGVGQKTATEGDAEGGSSTPADYNALSFVDVALILFALCFHAVFEGLAVGLATTVYDVWQMASSIAVNEVR